jgi:hypothetical protein
LATRPESGWAWGCSAAASDFCSASVSALDSGLAWGLGYWGEASGLGYSDEVWEREWALELAWASGLAKVPPM